MSELDTEEFDCEDCGVHVFSIMRAKGMPPVCVGCYAIRDIKSRGPLTVDQEANLRRILHCERDTGEMI